MTEKEAFRYWGLVNGWSEETHKKFPEAEKMHKEAMALHPELHQMVNIDTPRGWHDYKCSCGFHWGYDSGD